jgi:hypothetical protein
MAYDDDEIIRKEPRATAKQLRESYEGEELVLMASDHERPECDWCSVGMRYETGPRVSQYIADRCIEHPSMNEKARYLNETRPFAQFATLCEECSTRRLLFPCEGYAEVRLFFTPEGDRESGFTMTDIEITDHSDRDDGIPWDPKELVEAVTQEPFDTRTRRWAAGGGLWGPEDFVRIYMAGTDNRSDIRAVFDHEGNLDPKEVGRARREFQKRTSSHESRRDFRDRVRGGRGGKD